MKTFFVLALLATLLTNNVRAELIYSNKDLLTFNGQTSSVVTEAYDPEYALTGPFSMAATFVMTSHSYNHANNWVRVFGRGSFTERNYGLFYHPTWNYFLFQVRTSHGDFNALYTSNVSMNTQYSMVGTFDGSYMQLFVNGQQVASNVLTGNILTDQSPLTIGGEFHSSHTVHRGTITEVGLWSDALSLNEVMNYHLNGVNEPLSADVSAPIGLASLLLGAFGFRRTMRKVKLGSVGR